MTHDTAVLTVVYPKSLPYFQEFLTSIELQDDMNFVLYVFADCVDIRKTIHGLRINMKIVDVTGSPAEIRYTAIKKILNDRFRKIIFADSDDRFALNRIKVLKDKLEHYDILFHNLYQFGSDFSCSEPVWGSRFIDRQKIAFQEIISGNCLGFSNTAINTRCIDLERLNLLSTDLLAFDWAFFAMILNKGFSAHFIQNTFTEYRQHANNIAEMFVWNENNIANGITVKLQQYSLLASIDSEFAKLQSNFAQLKQKYDLDENFKRQYCAYIKTLKIKEPLWWEAIQPWNI